MAEGAAMTHSPEPGVTYSIETRDLREEAQHHVNAAIEQGVDPWSLYRGHLALAREIQAILVERGQRKEN